jgi:hypothetical protein
MMGALGADCADADVAASDMDPRTFCFSSGEGRGSEGTPNGGLAVVGLGVEKAFQGWWLWKARVEILAVTANLHPARVRVEP